MTAVAGQFLTVGPSPTGRYFSRPTVRAAIDDIRERMANGRRIYLRAGFTGDLSDVLALVEWVGYDPDTGDAHYAGQTIAPMPPIPTDANGCLILNAHISGEWTDPPRQETIDGHTYETGDQLSIRYLVADLGHTGSTAAGS